MIRQFADIHSDIQEACDAVVVGSGAGGAVVARELAEAGLAVVVLEEGGYYTTEDFTTDTLTSLTRLYREAGATLAIGRPNVIIAEGRCVGGSTVINGGMSWRTPEKVLKRWQWEKGLTDLSPQAMATFFERVEKVIHVSPVPADTFNRDGLLLKRGAEALGYAVKLNQRSADRCVGTNNCVQGCPTGGKQSMVVSYLPRALAAGARLYANCRVHEILTKRGQAVGVKGFLIDPASKDKKFKIKIQAKVVVLACGAIQTPYLLLRNGLANSSGLVGKNLQLHPNAKVVGIYDEPVMGWQGVNQAYQVTQFADEGLLFGTNNCPPGILSIGLPYRGQRSLDLMREIYNHCVTAAVLIEDTARGRVWGMPYQPLITYQINQHDFHRALRGIAILSEIHFAAGARKVLLPLAHLQEISSADEIRKIFAVPTRPADLELLTVHIMGTCQMGARPKNSVVGPWHESHDVANLFVADASVFPTPIGVNPQETIMALATRCAAFLVDNQSRYFS